MQFQEVRAISQKISKRFIIRRKRNGRSTILYLQGCSGAGHLACTPGTRPESGTTRDAAGPVRLGSCPSRTEDDGYRGCARRPRARAAPTRDGRRNTRLAQAHRGGGVHLRNRRAVRRRGGGQR